MSEKFAVIAGNKKEAKVWAEYASLDDKDWTFVTEPKQLNGCTVIQTGNWYTASPEVLAAVAAVVEDVPEEKEPTAAEKKFQPH